MRILRGLSSRLLRCGCTLGIYETYSGSIVHVLDARGPACDDSSHRQGLTLRPDQVDALK
jgi:hypothetical protein